MSGSYISAESREGTYEKLIASKFDFIASAMAGGALGFLVYNIHPAKVFMGDTGSLFIGGIIMGCAISEGKLIAVLVMSLVFIFEIFSSLLQRYYYKLTKGKRIFKKAPVHHHFQLLGWSEVKIVLVFFAVSCVCAAIGVLCAVA